MFSKQIEFARNHIILTASSHLAAGFGLAIVLQDYLGSTPFLPVGIGWILVIFSLVIHIWTWVR